MRYVNLRKQDGGGVKKQDGGVFENEI